MSRADPGGITVVIPLYNKAATVARAIDSVLAQRGVPFEVVVVDDESTDGSREIAAAYAEPVRLFSQKNAGPSAARNRGVREAKYAWITFLDADDVFCSGCLLAHWRALQRRPQTEVSLVSFEFVGLDGARKPEYLASRIDAQTDSAGYGWSEGFRAALVVNVPPGALCVRRELFYSIGQFDTELVSWEITDFLVRLMKHARLVAVTDRIGMAVYETPDSQSTRTHRKPRYLARVCAKLLAELNTLPATEQKRMLKQMESFLRALWDVGALTELHALATSGRRNFIEHGIDDRFLRIAASPMPVLRTAHALRAIRQRMFA